MNTLITILGPTASGKTRLAAEVAARLNGEIISADSRQVYRGMNLGTGKDYADYIVNGREIHCHLIDIADPGEEYNVFRFCKDAEAAFKSISNKGKTAIMCGGTGLYIEAFLAGYKLEEVPHDKKLRHTLGKKSQQDLVEYLTSLRPVHNTTDTLNRERTIRAIEIAMYELSGNTGSKSVQPKDSLIVGVAYQRAELRRRITARLGQRLEEGMIAEVESLINMGVEHEKLDFYGLEYRYLSRYIRGMITYDEMFSQLNTAIHQFAKRQMTWFRRMERKGFHIHWLPGELSMEEKVAAVMAMKNEL